MSIKSRIKDLTPIRVLELREFIRRKRQSTKKPQDVFSEVYRAKYWGGVEHDFFSGWGSHAQPTIDSYVAAIATLAGSMPNARVTDIGCGDFNIGRHIRPLFGDYVACDVVPELIERNKTKFSGADVDFRCLDITTDPLPSGEIALVREVLQHLNNSQIAKFLDKVSGYKVLVITEHLPMGEFIPNMDKPTGVGIRAHGLKPSGVDISKPPFNFPCKSSLILGELPREPDTLRTTAYFL